MSETKPNKDLVRLYAAAAELRAALEGMANGSHLNMHPVPTHTNPDTYQCKWCLRSGPKAEIETADFHGPNCAWFRARRVLAAVKGGD